MHRKGLTLQQRSIVNGGVVGYAMLICDRVDDDDDYEEEQGRTSWIAYIRSTTLSESCWLP